MTPNTDQLNQSAHTPPEIETIVLQSEPNISALLNEAILAKQAENSDPLRTAAAAESRGESNAELEEVIDAIVGLKLLGIERGDEELVQNAERIFLTASVGGQAEQELTHLGLQKMASHSPQEARKHRHATYLVEAGYSSDAVDEIYQEPEQLDYEHLSIVHATDHLPVANREGILRIEDRFSADGHARSTVHTSLNAHVESHAYSSDWTGKRVVVVAPMNKVVKLNGEPTSLIGHDTWWEVVPGKGLELPEDAIIIHPGASKPVQVLSKGEIAYKVDGITADDVDELVTMATDYELSILARSLGVKVSLHYNHHSNSKLSGTSLSQYETELDPNERQRVRDALMNKINANSDKGNIGFSDLAKRVAVRKALEMQGREVIEPKTIMESSFMSEDLDEELRRLSLTRAGAGHHSESDIGRLERSVMGFVKEGRFIGDESVRRHLAQEIRQKVDVLGRGTLHMYYRLGLF